MRGRQARSGTLRQRQPPPSGYRDQDELLSVLDTEPVLSEELLGVARFMKERYFCTFYDAVKTMLPAGINYRLSTVYSVRAEDGGTILDEEKQRIYNYIYSKRKPVRLEKLMDDFAKPGRYELVESAKERLFADFEGGVATPEETEEEMRRMRDETGYALDPHTAVATCVARKLGYPKRGERGTGNGERACVVAATATPYKFPETCLRAFGKDVLDNPPPSFRDLERLPVAQTKVVDVAGIDQAVRDLF